MLETATLLRAARQLMAESERLMKRAQQGVKETQGLVERSHKLYAASAALLKSSGGGSRCERLTRRVRASRPLSSRCP
jgi:hypothetical protein